MTGGEGDGITTVLRPMGWIWRLIIRVEHADGHNGPCWEAVRPVRCFTGTGTGRSERLGESWVSELIELDLPPRLEMLS